MAPDLDEYRRTSRDSWDRFAGNWEREHDFLWSRTGPLGERLVERLDPQPGDTVLELAAGTGDTGFLAAERIGADGKLISTDFAPAMVEAARRGAEARDLGEAEFRVLDAERMDLDDSSVDGVLCRFGYMLMADPAAALSETRRVLRDGGRLSFAVWGPPDRNLWAAIPGMTMVEQGHMPPPEPGAPGIFALGDRIGFASWSPAPASATPRSRRSRSSGATPIPTTTGRRRSRSPPRSPRRTGRCRRTVRSRSEAPSSERVDGRLAEDGAALDGVADVHRSARSTLVDEARLLESRAA